MESVDPDRPSESNCPTDDTCRPSHLFELPLALQWIRLSRNRYTPGMQTACCIVLLFALNAVICAKLWFSGYLNEPGSVEGPFLAFSTWIAHHWGDLHWFPMWFMGMPFEKVYGPGLHWTVAAASRTLPISVVQSYRCITTALYCLGPVTLFWLCFRLTRSRTYGVIVGLTYSLTSPIVWLSSLTRTDIGGWFSPRRYQVLVHYGEGPHVAALTLVPLVIWALHEAIEYRRMRSSALAAVLFGAVLITNWTATAGLAMALTAYCVSRTGLVPPVRWLRVAAILMLGYALVSPQVPPSVVASIPRNAQASDGVYFGTRQFAGIFVLIILLATLHVSMARRNVSRTFRFFLYFFVISAAVVLSSAWWNISLTPQPHRFQLEMEMALTAAVAYPVWRWCQGTSRSVKATALVLFLAMTGFQFFKYRGYVDHHSQTIRMEGTIEYRAAKWLDDHAQGARVFAPGSIGLWMNLFTETPQMVGCCDQSIPSFSQRLAFYTVYTGENAGIRDAEDSIVWLKAYGVRIVGTSGPNSPEYFKPFRNPHKFDGVLPFEWREDDTTMYRVPTRSASLAHIIPSTSEVLRTPTDGLDLGEVRRYVRALENPALPLAPTQWMSAVEARVHTTLSPGEVVSLQITYAPAWRATANGLPVALHADGLGLIVAEPRCRGACDLDLRYGYSMEQRLTRWIQGLAVILCVILLLSAGDRQQTVEASSPVGSAAAASFPRRRPEQTSHNLRL